MMSTRPSISETLLEIAFTVSKRSTCSRRNNGAVIADSRGVVLSTGYNGSLSGQKHCDHECDCTDEFIVERLIGFSEKADNRDLHTETCPAHPNNGCAMAVHAEANAVYFAARNGVSVLGATIYCTTEPCTKCAEAIVQSGISKVVYKQEYRSHDGINLLQQVGIEVEQG
jgi:deoxycytidylate deaminase